MRIIRFYEPGNSLKVEPESFEDLYVLAMVISAGDTLGAKGYRRFKPSEGDEGEQKEVFINLTVEKVEIDKSAGRLRVTGKIVGGSPEEFIRINSYHTLNIGPSDQLEISKREWKDYLLKRIKQAVTESKRPRLGVIAIDDEKATVAYIRGYGIELVSEMYSRLSKKMKEKDYEKRRTDYFNDVIEAIERMGVDIVIVAGPGFTKDDIKKYVESQGIKLSKRVVYASASDAERSGVREVMQSSETMKLLAGEHVRKEFEYLNTFFNGLRLNKSISGIEKVSDALSDYSLGVIIVNDSVINTEEIKALLDKADKQGVRIEIFNSDDEAGKQLSAFRNIVGIEKSLLKGL
jgi:protein pelota